ncbi:MAG: hypothetical protein V1918_00970 [Planctomycetota bacterium]
MFLPLPPSKRFLLAGLLFGAAAALAGCVEPSEVRFATRALQPVNSLNERADDPAALTTIRSVAVLPFDNLSGEASFDPLVFAQTFAGQLSRFGRVRVVFPQEALRLLDRENEEVWRHNEDLRRLRLLGRDPGAERAERAESGLVTVTESDDKPKEPLNPMRREEDAVKLGRMLGVDAVFVGTVTAYDPYYRPRIAVTARALATGRGDAASQALRELTQWGIPRNLEGARGAVWLRQQLFDGREGGIARDIYLFARNRHTEDQPYDTEIYLRSMDRFFEFVTGTLADRFLDARKDAAEEALKRAEAEAAKRKVEKESILARVRALVAPPAELPDPDALIQENLPDRRDHSWRPRVYGLARPDKVEETPPEPVRGAVIRPEPSPDQ